MNKSFIADINLLLVAFVWGTTFVIVQNAIALLPPHSFNGVRFSLASISLLIVILIRDKKMPNIFSKDLLNAGLILGVLLFGGYAFQTIGLLYTTASKAGFITGLSVILVPLFAIFLLRTIPKWNMLFGVAFAGVGLYLLTMVKGSSFDLGDLLIFFCAIFFALQIIFTGKFAPRYDSLILAWLQISVVAILSLIFAIISKEGKAILSIELLLAPKVISALLITSIFATALAFLAQTTFQKYTTPTRVAIIFAMEPVFAALTAYLVQGEIFTKSAIIGGALIFFGMILAEIPTTKKAAKGNVI